MGTLLVPKPSTGFARGWTSAETQAEAGMPAAVPDRCGAMAIHPASKEMFHLSPLPGHGLLAWAIHPRYPRIEAE